MTGRLNDLGTRGGEVVDLDPRIIVIRKDWNYRDITSPLVTDHIHQLMENIRAHGVQQPVRVQYVDGKAYLVDGQCRVEACKLLWKDGLKVPYKKGGSGPPLVPALTVKGDEATLLAASMTANGSLPPTHLEFGAAAKRLKAYGWDEELIAKYVPVTVASDPARALKFVRDSIELEEAPLEVKDIVRGGVDGVAVSPALAVAVTKKNRLMAAEVLKEEAKRAKVAGKTVAKRPKGIGRAGKAKEAKETHREALERTGDRMADQILAMEEPTTALKSSAKAWNQQRGRLGWALPSCRSSRNPLSSTEEKNGTV
jgi:ParB-like chromosome segregation protein Spo0J